MRFRARLNPPLFGALGLIVGVVAACEPATVPLPIRNQWTAPAERAAILLGGGPLPTEIREDIGDRGKAAYEDYARFLADPDRNPQFAASVRRYFLRDMELKDEVVHMDHPQTGAPVAINLADGADLATYLVANNRPFTELLTHDGCVKATVTPTQSDGALTFEDVECSNDSPVHAGLLTQHGFLYSTPSTSGLERARVWKLYLACEPQTVSADPGWASCNACEGDVDSPLLPSDPPGPAPRMHAKFAVPSNTSWCATCHHWLNPRRQFFVKYDESGFYNRGRTLFDAERPELNFGRCISPPLGSDVDALQVCPDAGFSGPQDNDWPYGCCFDPTLTDANATAFMADSPFACVDDNSAFCAGEYYGEQFAHLGEVGAAMATGDLDDNLFATCATTRLANYFLDRDRGLFRDRVADRAPLALTPDEHQRWTEAFIDADHNLAQLMETLLLDQTFLALARSQTDTSP